MRFLSKGITPAIGWFVLSFILLTLPGSAFPKETWLSKLQFDKFVHIFLFAVLVWFFCRAQYRRGKSGRSFKYAFVTIALLSILYGVVMEFVQKYFVANRSFDIGDIIADAIGAALGYALSYWLYIRKKKSTA